MVFGGLSVATFVTLGLIIVVCVLTSFSAYQKGALDGADAAIEFLICEKILQPEIFEENTMLRSCSDVAYFDKCDNCGEGWIGNPSATKRHRIENED